ncbi:MAG: hypothetical protein HQK49_15075 [Oligoflexia bacterium]|nr:hypothetical protein [Oligoflexia bacterium]
MTNTAFSNVEYIKLREYIKKHDYLINCQNIDMGFLKSFLIEKRSCIMRLLENPNLLEQESFTDLLWAVSHLTEELSYRKNVQQLTIPDRTHLEGDIERTLSLLTTEWLVYVKHLQKYYPYIYSLVIRTNPFILNSSAEVK